MKFLPATLLFISAAIIAYYNRTVRLYAAEKFKEYLLSVNNLIKTSVAGVRQSAIIRIEITAGLAAAALAVVTGQWYLAIVAVPLMAALPKFYVDNRLAKYKKEYYEGLVPFLESVISSLKAGSSVVKAFQEVAARDRGPVGQEMSLVLRKLELGLSLQDALNELSDKIAIKENEIIISAVNTALETGGNITEVLSNILDTIRKREELRREVKTLTSQGLLSGIIVGLLPVFMVVIISFMDPGFIAPLFNTPVGIALLLTAVAMELIGAFIISRIVDIK